MFDLLRKPRVWHAWDNGLAEEIGRTGTFELKAMQDLAVYAQLRGASGMQIAEVCAGRSRLLPTLAKSNTCTIIEPEAGPNERNTEAEAPAAARRVEANLGDHDAGLEPSYFDIVFSVSVIQHVATADLESFHRDQLRVLKPGGVFLHAIDLYLDDGPDVGQAARFAAYRSWVAASDGVEPVGDVYDGPFRFTCDLATNPDNIVHSWGKIAPAMDAFRQRSQVVSVLLAGRKAGTTG
jgi:SAM-dependent methyltransferase